MVKAHPLVIVAEHLFPFLDIPSFANVCATSRTFKQIGDIEKRWKALFGQHTVRELSYLSTWKEQCKRLAKQELYFERLKNRKKHRVCKIALTCAGAQLNALATVSLLIQAQFLNLSPAKALVNMALVVTNSAVLLMHITQSPAKEFGAAAITCGALSTLLCHKVTGPLLVASGVCMLLKDNAVIGKIKQIAQYIFDLFIE